MRKQMIQSVSDVIKKNPDTSLFLVDIGVWGFRDVLSKYPERAMNVGIFEDGIISIAAGLSLSGIVPFVYGISPFILGRAYEQLKLNFCYQRLAGNFITTGASHDFSTLGYSHYCSEDIELVKALPGMEFVAPGTAKEYKILFEKTWDDGNPTYYRLSDYSNKTDDINVEFGKAAVLKEGNLATVIAVSTMLDVVLDACRDIDVTILYYTTLKPFDRGILRHYCTSGKILICEPHYKGALVSDVNEAIRDQAIKIFSIGIPRKILRSYGTKLEKDRNLGFTGENIRNALIQLINS